MNLTGRAFFLVSSTLIMVTLCAVSALPAQGKNPKPAKKKQTWEDVKAEKYKEVSKQHKKLISAAVPSAATVKSARARRILLFYRCEGFFHQSIPSCNYAVEEMARKTCAFDVDLADSYEVFDAENLKKYDGIVLNNTTGMRFSDPERLNALMDFIVEGKGLAGIHAASDNFERHPVLQNIVGGRFAGHPWRANGTWAFKLDDPQHVLNKAFDGHGFWHADEIYQYGKDTFQGPAKLRILVSLDMSKEEVSKQINDGPREVPVSWIQKAGEGRMFYTNFGHREETYQNPAILRHMLNGIQYALGDLKADDTPTAQIDARKHELAPANP